jgi:phage replication-related protein YjqB (UPF0714/DUF867 family)
MREEISYLEPLERRQATLVDWLLRGDERAANRLVTVRVKNGCGDRECAHSVAKQLEEQGFQVSYAGRALEELPTTRTEGKGRHANAAQRVATALGLQEVSHWEPSREDAVVTVTVGHDQKTRLALDDHSVVPPSLE